MVGYIVATLAQLGVWAMMSPVAAFKVAAITYIVLL
tara:strand:- start:349 stop:456 length:108 start_codon:yes stop_codon:yes gene_type:complete